MHLVPVESTVKILFFVNLPCRIHQAKCQTLLEASQVILRFMTETSDIVGRWNLSIVSAQEHCEAIYMIEQVYRRFVLYCETHEKGADRPDKHLWPVRCGPAPSPKRQVTKRPQWTSAKGIAVSGMFKRFKTLQFRSKVTSSVKARDFGFFRVQVE